MNTVQKVYYFVNGRNVIGPGVLDGSARHIGGAAGLHGSRLPSLACIRGLVRTTVLVEALSFRLAPRVPSGEAPHTAFITEPNIL